MWHNWNEPESLIIEQWFQDFMTVHPYVHIVSEYVSSADFDEQFVSQIASGLGPDLIIGVEVGRLRELVDRGLLVDLTATGLDTGQVLTHAVSALQVDEQLYGLPFAAFTDVLFYNKSLVDRPPRTLDEFLQEARAGKQIALPINFQHAYWGVRTFGGSLLGEDGELASDPALVDWLDWLILAQKETVVLSPDYAELKKLFAAGSAAYFIGSSIELSAFREALGEETVGVALLPYPEPSQEEAQNDDAQVELNLRQNYAGGFLELQVMAISVMSSQTDLAISVIEFFTNQTHQRELAQYDYRAHAQQRGACDSQPDLFYIFVQNVHGYRPQRARSHLLRTDCEIKPKAVIELLINAALSHAEVLKKPPPSVFLLEYGDNVASFQLNIWLDNPVISPGVVSEVKLLAWDAFAKNNIALPFPETEIHFSNRKPLQMLNSAANGTKMQTQAVATE